MTGNRDIRAASDLNVLASEILEDGLGRLIRRHVQRPSQNLASAVVRRLEALYLHPDDDGNAAQRCAYRRLAHHWRCLSQDLRPATEARRP